MPIAPPAPVQTTLAFPPAPPRNDENWRFADLKQLADLDGLATAPDVDPAPLVARTSYAAESSARLVFVNGQLAEQSGDLPAGVVCESLETARAEHAGLVDEHFMTQPVGLGSAAYADLHRANTKTGIVIHVPANTELEHPIEVTHWLSGDNAVLFPHTLVVAGANAKVSVVEHFRSADDTSASFSVGVCDLVAADGAKITYANTQRWNANTRGVQITSTSAARDADVKSFTLNLGGRWVRNEATSHLNGPGANSDMLSVNVATGDQQFDQRTLQLHHAPNTTSDLLYKNALYDTAKTVFAGLIVVDDGAHHTDAYQTCRNLLNSEEAEASSLPGLEINADQVKCSHGSTSGQIDLEQLFYLMARGISERQARKLITLGFTHEVIDRLGDDDLVDECTALIDAKFAALG